MRTNRKNLLSSALFCGTFFVFWLVALPLAHGATKLECAFGAQLNELGDVQSTTTLSYEKRLESELAIRKNILINIADCSAKEIKTFEGIIKALPSPNTNRQIQDAITRFTQQLENALSFYQNQKMRVAGLTLWESKRMAQDILEWRTSIYAPIEEKITYFIIWDKNQSLMSTAEHRFTQIQDTIRTLKLQDNEDIAKFLEAAKKDLEAAKQDNYNAQQVLTDPNSPNDSLTLVKTSLEKLAKAYQSFFDLSEAVNIILPH